jgi:hypothetical protein
MQQTPLGPHSPQFIPSSPRKRVTYAAWMPDLRRHDGSRWRWLHNAVSAVAPHVPASQAIFMVGRVSAGKRHRDRAAYRSTRRCGQGSPGQSPIHFTSSAPDGPSWPPCPVSRGEILAAARRHLRSAESCSRPPPARATSHTTRHRLRRYETRRLRDAACSLTPCMTPLSAPTVARGSRLKDVRPGAKPLAPLRTPAAPAISRSPRRWDRSCKPAARHASVA